MEVKVLKPIGECFWVKNVLTKVEGIVKENQSSNIYIFGSLIHNKLALKNIDKPNVKFIKFTKNAAELEHFLEKSIVYYDEDVFIFSAHGHTKEHEKVVKRYFKNVLDFTCPKITNQHKIIFENLDNNIIFVGEGMHEESQNAVSFGDNIYLYDLKDKMDFSLLDKTRKTVVISQSTLSDFDITNAIETIKANIEDVEFKTTICSEVSSRQNELLNEGQNYDVVLVLGSRMSANTKRMYEIAKEVNKEVRFIEDLYDLKALNIDPSKKVLICSGTSCPSCFIDEVITYLENL